MLSLGTDPHSRQISISPRNVPIRCPASPVEQLSCRRHLNVMSEIRISRRSRGGMNFPKRFSGDASD